MIYEPTPWMLRAACKGESVDLFFGGPDGAHASKDVLDAMALRICRRCPVARQCLSFAIDTGQKYGVWGGLSSEDRADETRRRRRRRAA